VKKETLQMHARTAEPDRRRHSRTFAGERHRPELESNVLGTYSEMPGLLLHIDQAARLLGLKSRTCEVVFDALIRDGRLRRTPGGQYALA
jgi:hypothetical protein